MSDQRGGGIAWTDSTWNPVRGCSRVSAGCQRCYAETMAARFSGPGQPYEGLAERTPSGGRWTGKVRLVPERLADPLRWKRPRRIFVNSMSDLFHEKLSFEEIAAVFGVMALAQRHTFQVLTKRPDRFLRWLRTAERFTPRLLVAKALEYSNALLPTCDGELERWPLPNVWIGVSAEDQATADERIRLLLQTPAAVRFVSYEPALGPVDFTPWLTGHDDGPCPKSDPCCLSDDGECHDACESQPRIDWLIVGGESGPHARPFDCAWARSVVQQCKAAGVACFVKQIGPHPEDTRFPLGPRVPLHTSWRTKDRKGGDMTEWPKDLRVREFPEVRR